MASAFSTTDSRSGSTLCQFSTRRWLASTLISTCLLTNLAIGAESVVFQADFEEPTPAGAPGGPPTGWSMWGAARYKDPSHFTRDTQTPHQGTACFRIYHPAQTDGYIVSSPEVAVRPQSGKTYTATFWARSDRAGEALFGWTAYRQVRPFMDAPSPGSFPLQVDPQWKMFEFTFNRHVGRWVLAIDGTAPYRGGSAGGRTYRGPLTPVVATLSEDEQQLYLIMANGSWETAVPTRISLRSRLPRQVTGIVLSHGDADGDPFLANREELVQDLAIGVEGQDLTALLPPHAVAFITIRLD